MGAAPVSASWSALPNTVFEIPGPPPDPRMPAAVTLLRVSPVLRGLADAFSRRGQARRAQRYRDQLDILRARLAELLTAEQSALAAQQPDVAGCLRLVISEPERLWQRPPTELLVRVGTAAAPSSLAVVAPTQPDPLRVDPLIEAAQALAAMAARLPEAPTCMLLDGCCALRAPRQHVLGIARAVLVQLATHCSPRQLSVGIVFPEAEQDAWRWARWLPHVQTADGRRRLASQATAVQPLLAECHVVVIADSGLCTDVPPGVLPVYVLDETDPLPYGCARVLDVDDSLRGVVGAVGKKPLLIERVDTASVYLAERLARELYGRTASATAADEGIVEVHLDGSRTPLGGRS